MNSKRPEILLRPLSPGQCPALVEAARADGNHAVIDPTHVVMRGDEIVGYGSIGRVRMFYAWLDTQKLSGMESFNAWRQAEMEMQRLGGPIACPCKLTSPLLPFMERKGYKPLGDVRLFRKEF
jgi:hypothetical protein